MTERQPQRDLMFQLSRLLINFGGVVLAGGAVALVVAAIVHALR